MSGVLSVVVAVLGVGLLILVHEFGHFVVAKLTGMRVEEFSLGFGPYLVKRRVGDTVYGISAFPVGGYVRVTGMHEEDFQARVEAVEEARTYKGRDAESRMTGRSALSDEEIIKTPLQNRYYAKPVWQRVLFIVAGVSMNVVAAFVILFFLGVRGYFVPSTVISNVEPGSGAAAAGLLEGDRLLSIDGQAIDDWNHVQEIILANPDATVTVVVERAARPVTVRATIGTREDGSPVLGIRPEVDEVKPNVWQAVTFAGGRTGELFRLTFRGWGMMLSGEAPVTGPQGIAGPVGIVSISSEAFRGGYFLSLLAFISVQLTILNMLPLLPLDGGHVLFSIIEKVTGKALSLRTFESVSVVGIALFLLLFLVATGNDLGRLFSGTVGF
ncbi:MAG: M50 family metallopeptidase [Thermoleophilia bacterium]|nr:M50 family metallopeptidase [Thermoleophilia bacterium]